jgi:hypothetical protein
MNGSRMVWIIWCVAWAGAWVLAFFIFGRLTSQAAVFTAIMALLSLVAIALPIGGERTEDCPVCHDRFPQANMGLHMAHRHSISPVTPPAR